MIPVSKEMLQQLSSSQQKSTKVIKFSMNIWYFLHKEAAHVICKW